MNIPLRGARWLPVLFATILTSCASADPAAAVTGRSLRVRADGTSAIRDTVVVRVAITDPKGQQHEATGVATTGGTVRGLCESLRSSLAARSCNATYRSGEMTDDQLRDAMHQVIALPAGWTLVGAGVENQAGAKSTVVTATIESGG